jgi:solute carrier family 25 S-adenosylmethionine transporter 26
MGFLSGILTAVVTCPIDCVNTRIKSGELSTSSMIGAHMEIVRKNGAAALFRGVLPRCVIIGFGSMVFWGIQASLLTLF